MNILKKSVFAVFLIVGIGVWNEVNAQNMSHREKNKLMKQLQKIEARIDAKLKKMEQPSSASSSESASDSSSSQVPALDSRTLIVNKTVIGDNCRFYAFKKMKELEELLKTIAESHWKVNESNDLFIQLKNIAAQEKNKGNYERAADVLKRAQETLNRSGERRKVLHEEFERLLREGYAFYNTKNIAKRTSFTEIDQEFTAFIIETAEKGKYVRAWAFSAKGGMEVTISGREVTINRKQ